ERERAGGGGEGAAGAERVAAVQENVEDVCGDRRGRGEVDLAGGPVDGRPGGEVHDVEIQSAAEHVHLGVRAEVGGAVEIHDGTRAEVERGRGSGRSRKRAADVGDSRAGADTRGDDAERCTEAAH